MNHSFNIDIAKEYSIEEAIILENMAFWINKNMANKKNERDGRYWTYNSQSALTKIFPYWSRSQIQRIIKKLETNELIVKGNFNKAGYDKTTWYALTDKALEAYGLLIVRNRTMDCAKSNNGLCEIEQPIPVINAVIKEDIKDHNVESEDEKEKPVHSTKVEQIPYKEIIEYLNNKTNKRFNYKSNKTRDLIKARYNEGYLVNDFKKVIDYKCKEWLNNNTMNKYLRPATLFSNKFDNYINEVPKERKEKSSAKKEKKESLLDNLF